MSSSNVKSLFLSPLCCCQPFFSFEKNPRVRFRLFRPQSTLLPRHLLRCRKAIPSPRSPRRWRPAAAAAALYSVPEIYPSFFQGNEASVAIEWRIEEEDRKMIRTVSLLGRFSPFRLPPFLRACWVFLPLLATCLGFPPPPPPPHCMGQRLFSPSRAGWRRER